MIKGEKTFLELKQPLVDEPCIRNQFCGRLNRVLQQAGARTAKRALIL